jgi:hypothetical protein
MKKSMTAKLTMAVALILLGVSAQAQTPFYSVNGTGGTGGGTAGITVTPSISPSGSSTLTDLGATANLSFGTGPGGVAGESIVNAATGQAGAQVLAGTLGASSSLSAFTVTLWVNMATATLNNYRYVGIAPGSPPTGSTADGTQMFLGLNAGGGVQFYANNVNNNYPQDVAGSASWNNGGTLGSVLANNWYFVAVTYDTVAGSALLYSGDQNDPAVLAYTYGNTVYTSGNLNLSSATSIALTDRFSSGRNFPGQIDDVNLYSGALTQSQLQAIQLSEAPEPCTLAIAGLGGMAGLITMMRRHNS